MTNINNPRIAPIHSGDKTHHQDQLIYPVSFNTINTIVKSPVNPIPELELLDESDILPPKLNYLSCSKPASGQCEVSIITNNAIFLDFLLSVAHEGATIVCK